MPSLTVGYCRTSTLDQDPALQLDALRLAGCDPIYTEQASGARADRPQLARALEHLRDGDTLVVWRLDRLGRSLADLMTLTAQLRDRGVALRSLKEHIDTGTATGNLLFAVMGAIGEFESAVMRERTHAGLAAARERGRPGGRRPKMTKPKRENAQRMYDSGDYTIAQIAKEIGVSRATIYRSITARASLSSV